jgi:hypothetical protein
MMTTVRAVPVLLSVLLFSACAKSGVAAPRDEDLQAARAAAQQLGVALKSRLVEAMSSQGPIAAVEVCALEVSQIASGIADATEYEVSRTALRVRNPSNAPDAWEREQLEKFIAAADSGADPRMLEAAILAKVDGVTVFRWMKPIIMEAQCAACHGASVAPEIKQKINEYYPDDAATGFREGEIRGAFSVSKRISAPGEKVETGFRKTGAQNKRLDHRA